MEAYHGTLKLRTIKKIHQEVGISQSYIKQLLREGKLSRFKIGNSTYVSLVELEKLAISGMQRSSIERPSIIS